MLNDVVVNEFVHRFYGYGTYTESFWFIGMEEGGGDSEAEVQDRIHAWDSRGNCELEDLAEYHRVIGVDRHFSSSPILQKTWAKLIRLLLGAQGRSISTEHIRAYQRDQWGRSDGNTCLIELLPLPSPSLGHWLYAECSALPYLTSRETYRQELIQGRIDHIKQRISEYQPQAVIFYGLEYRTWWEVIAEAPFEVHQDVRLFNAQGKYTHYLMVQHPVAFGMTNAYFEQAGNLLNRGDT